MYSLHYIILILNMLSNVQIHIFFFFCFVLQVTELKMLSPHTVKQYLSLRLSCNYTGSVDSLHWYRQYAASPPQFLILDYYGSVTQANPPVSGISISPRKEDNSVDLIISSAAVSDSALYYCALQPTVTGNTQHTVQEPD